MAITKKTGLITTILANKYQLMLCLVGFFFLLYFRTMPQTNVGYGDSDEFLSVGYHLGVAHPPGYPIYVFLLYLFMHLPLPLALAAKGHLLSVFLASITLGVVSLSVFEIIQLLNRSHKYRHVLSPGYISLLTTLLLGLSPLFWLYAIITEKVALSSILTAISLYLSLKSFQQPKYLSLAFLILGISVSHHPLLVTLLLPVIYVIWKNRQILSLSRITRWFLIFSFSLILPLLLLIPLNQRSVPVSWQFEPNLPGFFQHVTRAAFYGDAYAKNQQVSSIFSNLNTNQGFAAIGQMGLYFINNFSLFSLILIFLISLRFYQKITSLDIFLITAFLSLGFLVAFVLQYPNDSGTQGILMRQWYPALIPFALLLSLGWFEFLQRLSGFSTLLFPKTIALLLVTLIPLSVVVFIGFKSFPQMDFSQNTLIHDRYQNILERLPQNTLLTCFSDVSCFALLFQQSVLNQRADIDIIPLHYPLIQNTLKKADLMGFSYPGNPFLMSDIISWNLLKRPVYALELNSYFYQFLGLDVPFIYYLPEGYYGRLSLSVPKELVVPPNYTETRNFQSWSTFGLDPYRTFQKSLPARDHILNAQMYLKMDQRNLAISELNLASNLYYTLSSHDSAEFQKLRVQLEQSQPIPNFALGSKSPSSATLLSYIPQLVEKNFISRALRVAQGSILIDPKNPATHFELAKLYETVSEVNFAFIEYLNTQTLDHNYPGLIEKLAKFNVVE
jgi:hypothetical protein